MSYKGQYFVVRDGLELREDYSNVKFTKTRVFNGIDACKQTFGKVTKDMFVKGIGTSRTVLGTFKGRVEFITNPDGWISMDGVTIPDEKDLESKEEIGTTVG